MTGLGFSTAAAYPGFGALNGYWGQFGAESLRQYCDTGIEYVTLSFVNEAPEHSASNYPGTNFAGHCWASTYTAPNGASSKLLSECRTIKNDIPYCREKGVKVLLSIGGEYSEEYSNYRVTTTENGEYFANFLYKAFGPYDPSWTGPRPFDLDANTHTQVDGFDFDIEADFDNEPYIRMAEKFRELDSSMFLTAAPQCPTIEPYFHLRELIQRAPLDALFVQFYNNAVCDAIRDPGLAGDGFNYNAWADLLARSDKSQNAKLFIGLLASPAASISGSGFISAQAMKDLVCQYKDSPSFGGISLWDLTRGAAQISNGKNYYQHALDALKYGCAPVPTSTSRAITSTTSTRTSTSTRQPTTTTTTTIRTSSSSSVRSSSSSSVRTSTSTTSSTIRPTTTSTTVRSSSTASPSSTLISTTSARTSTATSSSSSASSSPSSVMSSSSSSSISSSSTSSSSISSSSTSSSSSSSIMSSSSLMTTTTSGIIIETPPVSDTSLISDVFTSVTSAASTTSAETVSTSVSSVVSVPTTTTVVTSSPISFTSTRTWSNSTMTTSSAPGTSDVSVSAPTTTTVMTSLPGTLTSTRSWSNTTFTTSDTGSLTTRVATLTTSAASLTTSAVSLTTSTVYTTKVQTVTKCPPYVVDCPEGGYVTTVTVPWYTTVCPVTETPKPTGALTTSTVYATKVYTVTKCPPGVANCPTGHATTETVPVYTTVCPVGETITVPLTTSTAYTTATYTVTACPEGVVDCPTGHMTTVTEPAYTTIGPIEETSVVPEPTGDVETQTYTLTYPHGGAETSTVVVPGGGDAESSTRPGIAVPTDQWVNPIPSGTPGLPDVPDVPASASSLAVGLGGLLALAAVQVFAL